MQGYLKGKLIIDLHNQNGATLLAVSHDANKLCKLLTKELNEHWKDTFIAMDQGSAKMQLHVLGEYAYRGSSPSRLALSDYELLPEAVSVHPCAWALSYSLYVVRVVGERFYFGFSKGAAPQGNQDEGTARSEPCESRRNSYSWGHTGDCKVWEGSGTASSGGSS